MKKIKKLDFGVDNPNLKQPNFDGYESKRNKTRILLILSGICVGLAIGSFVLITTYNKDYAKISTYQATNDSQSITAYEQGVLDSMRIRLQTELAAIKDESSEESSLDIYYLDESADLSNLTDQVSSISTEPASIESIETLYESTVSSSVNPESSESSVTKGLDESTVRLIDWKNVTNEETYAKDVSNILTTVFGPLIIDVVEDDVILVITDVDSVLTSEIITDSYNQIFGKTPTIKTQNN